MTALSHLLLVEAVDKKGLCSHPDKLMGPHGRHDKPHRIFSSEISNWEGDGRLSYPRPIFSLAKVMLRLMGNRSKHGKCGPAPNRKSQWGARFAGQDPHPRIGSPVGNQACIVPRLLLDLLLLKLPHSGLRQQMFTAYL